MRIIYSRSLAHCLYVTLFGCIIEVGNPHDEEQTEEKPIKNQEETTPFQLMIADSPIPDLANVYLNIESVGLITEAGNILQLQLKSQPPVDLLKLSDGKSALLASEEVPKQQYLGVLLSLRPLDLGLVKLGDGSEFPLNLPDESQHIQIDKTINLQSLAAESILLHFDLLQSLTEKDETFLLEPLVVPIRVDQAAVLKGNIVPSKSGILCAYRKNESSSLFLDRSEGEMNQRSESDNSTGNRNITSESRNTSNETMKNEDEQKQRDSRIKEAPAKDSRTESRSPPSDGRPQQHDSSVSICGDATQVARLQAESGGFSLHHLEAGEYEFRVITTDQEVFDILTSTKIAAGDTIEGLILEVSPTPIAP